MVHGWWKWVTQGGCEGLELFLLLAHISLYLDPQRWKQAALGSRCNNHEPLLPPCLPHHDGLLHPFRLRAQN